MAQPTVSQVHIDAALSNIAIGYKNAAYIADQIFPVVPVEKESDYYYIWTKDFWFRNHVEKRAEGALFAEGGLTLSTARYSCVNKGLSFPITVEQLANEDAAIQLERTGAEWLADQFALDREIELATKIFSTSNWTSSSTLSSTTQWSDYENSDPLGNAATAHQTIQGLTGVKANVAVMGATVYDNIRRHPDLLDMYKYTNAGILNEAQVAACFEVDKILVGRAVKNTSGEGATFSGSYIWGDYCLFIYVPPRPGLRVAAPGYTFAWKKDGLTLRIDRFDDGLRKRYLLRGEMAYDQKITSADCGYILEDTVA